MQTLYHLASLNIPESNCFVVTLYFDSALCVVRKGMVVVARVGCKAKRVGCDESPPIIIGYHHWKTEVDEWTMYQSETRCGQNKKNGRNQE